MTFEINGVNGYYDGKINDASVRYGRNSVANHKELVNTTLVSGFEGEAPILDFMPTEKALDNNVKQLDKFVKDNDSYLKSMPPISYEYRYMPLPKDGNIDKKALFGAAYEEMGVNSLSVEDFDKKYLPKNEYTSASLDVNKDGKIDIAEYSASMLAADMLSKNSPSINNVDGSINSKGMNAVVEYSRISRAEAAAKLYSQIHATYKLNELA